MASFVSLQRCWQQLAVSTVHTGGQEMSNFLIPGYLAKIKILTVINTMPEDTQNFVIVATSVSSL